MTTAFQGSSFQNNAFQIDGVTPVVADVVQGGKGDNDARRRGTFKPTGLPPIKRGKKAVPGVEARVAETHEIAKEVAREALATAPPLVEMTAAEIDFEIGKLLKKAMRTDGDEIVLLTLMAAAAVL